MLDLMFSSSKNFIEISDVRSPLRMSDHNNTPLFIRCQAAPFSYDARPTLVYRALHSQCNYNEVRVALKDGVIRFLLRRVTHSTSTGCRGDHSNAHLPYTPKLRWPNERTSQRFMLPRQVCQQFPDSVGMEGLVGLGGTVEPHTWKRCTRQQALPPTALPKRRK